MDRSAVAMHLFLKQIARAAEYIPSAPEVPDLFVHALTLVSVALVNGNGEIAEAGCQRVKPCVRAPCFDFSPLCRFSSVPSVPFDVAFSACAPSFA